MAVAPPTETFREQVLRARLRALRGQTVTAARLRAIYRSSADSVARDIIRMLDRRLPDRALSARHLQPIMEQLHGLSVSMSEQILDATLQGLELAVAPAIASAEGVALQRLGDFFARPGLRAFYHSVNNRAVVAFATRAYGDDGLKLSDRVWQIGRSYRDEVRSALGDGIARGQDARRLAAEVQRHLHPDRVTPHSLSVRRRLHLSSRIDYRAMRLARTEMGNAFREATILGHSTAPSYLGSQWELSAAHPFEDECDELAQGEDGFGFYSFGNEPLAPHPNCMCVLTPVHQSDRDFEARLERWLDDPASDRALEEWHQTTIAPFFRDLPKVTSSGDVIRPAPANPHPRVPIADVDRAFDQVRSEVSRRR